MCNVFIENTKTIEYIGELDEKSNDTQISRVGDGDEGQRDEILRGVTNRSKKWHQDAASASLTRHLSQIKGVGLSQ